MFPNGPFGNMFPYTNFHSMNLDWVIQVAKDFLDQYTHIQEIIETGETSITDKTAEGIQGLEDKAEALQALLDEWYNEHSEDIADELRDALDDITTALSGATDDISTALTNAISSFDTAAGNRAALAIASIPSDYTDFYTNAFKWIQYATSSDDALDLTIGSWGLAANNLPSNLPSGYSGNGLLVVLDRSSTGNLPAFRLLFTSYTKRFWYHTGYEWKEVLTSASLSDYYKYIDTLPTNTDPRTAAVGLYNLIPSNTYLNLPPNYDTSGYGWCMVMYQQVGAGSTLAFLSDGEHLWQAITAGGWRSITTYNTMQQEKICLFGDSLTEVNSTASKNWTKLMEDAGFVIQNLAKGGTGFARATQADGRYADQISFVDNGTTIIGVSGSFNDLAVSLPMGDVTDTGNTTICGYINQFFNSLMTMYPTIPIICYVMTPWGTANYNDSKTKEYAEKLEEICKMNNIPFKSLLTCSTLRPWQEANRQYYYNTDAVHPNNEGYKIIFRHLLPLFMESCRNANDWYYSIGLANA